MITPNWHVAKKINAFTVCRDDNLLEVVKYLPSKISWLNQVHSNNFLDIDNLYLQALADPHKFSDSKDMFTKHISNTIEDQYKQNLIAADASFTSMKNLACVVKTADCLPVLVTNSNGDWVCAIHAGWRGLLAGVIENTISVILRKYDPHKILIDNYNDLIVWLGPAICAKHFIVGDDVRNSFLESEYSNKLLDELAFTKVVSRTSLTLGSQPINTELVNKWHADLYKLAINRLKSLNINQIVSSDICTYCHADICHSYRRDKDAAGRLATFIWLD